MAIFNWTKNPYFTSACYVSRFGSDSNDGSANAPYRTVQKAKDAGKASVQLGPGVYREAPSYTGDIFGEQSIVDLTLSVGYLANTQAKRVIGIKMVNAVSLSNCSYQNSILKDIVSGSQIDGASINVNNNIFKNIGISGTASRSVSLYNTTSHGLKNCTFDNCWVVLQTTSSSLTGMTFCIFSNCKIEIVNAFVYLLSNNYNLFYNCTFKFGTDTVYKTQADIESLYGVSGIDAIRAYYNAKFGTFNVFPTCLVADPLFNNSALDDYSLKPYSPARNMAYDGTYIGAKDVGYPTYAYANDQDHPNSFYNASKSANVIVANNSITLARNVDGSAVGGGNITEKSKDLGKIQEIKSNQLSFAFADRNREMPNASPTIDMTAPIAAGTALVSGMIYINEVDTVLYNAVLYPIRSRIYAIDTNTFTGNGVLYKVINNAQNNTNLIRFKQSISGAKISAGTNLTVNSWYRVYDNLITWNGLNIGIGDVFQAIAGRVSFSGSGKCVEEFNDTDVWGEYVINAPILVKRIGNISMGAIDTGTDGKLLSNGHPEYDNATNKARTGFTIFARYVQVKHFLSASEAK